MRKVLVLMLVVAAMSFVACGNDSGDSGSTTAPEADGDFDAFCAAAQEFAQALGTSGSPDFEAMKAALADMEANAPEEIKADVTTLKEGFEKGLAGEKIDPMQDAEVQAANDRIFEYLGQSECEPPEDA